MVFNKDNPHNDLPLLPPECEVETKAILKKAIKANKALAELKSKGSIIPNQNILIDTLTLIEAKDSSEIENIFTTHDKLYQASLLGEKNADPSTKEVECYRQALWHGIEYLRKRDLSTNLFIELVQIIKKNNASVRRIPGTKIANSQDKVIYTPPEGEDVIRTKLFNLEKFIHSNDDIDPLIKLAIIHYQFEAIHPFSDGNGRVGRIINILYLVHQNLLDTPVLFLSRYFIKHRKGYYEGLRNVTEKNDWSNWILYMLDAVEHTACQTMKKIDDIVNLMNNFTKIIKEKHPKIYSKDLIEVLFSKPYCRILSLTDAEIVGRQTASEYLKRIEELGLIKGTKIGKEMVYLNLGLLDILRK
ncbi:Fic family protein [Candidatus Nucleicultrix amoebiphila]|jgi:Fic family protein|uniref:Addiction module protein n=1 Tax=Candidatus Nucleicultrix amoebiphila FS5 TaxID=1414854 RepID=A0A1W6N5K2_9PROT|nr:Fic/DOC family N-terminal domain-containing protein [Candidatus Nucleicultrix amoebiphila]ARN85091.1 addiction module protein [Candidatus Nucleicultrix amoebiphila FS5]